MLSSRSSMEHSGNQPLSPLQERVADALAAGCTLTSAAAQFGVHRVTVYRWIKTHKEFTAAIRTARAAFVLARRDDLHHLSNRALETLLAILDNPRSSPAVLFKTAAFILNRPQLPKTGWSMPEPSPKPDDNKLTGSAIIEQDYDGLPGLCDIERDPPSEAEIRMESAASNPQPPPANASPRNEMQHDSGVSGVASDVPKSFLHSSPLPANVYFAREGHAQYLDFCENIKALEAQTSEDLKSATGRESRAAI